MPADDVKHKWYCADFDSLSIYVDAVDWITGVCYNPSAQNMWSFFMNTLNDGLDCLSHLINSVTV